ncbi:MAG: pantetheine-phosphate adenylyltransferase [Thermanaeromonas sp.]|uniref:pantetheine-phosphate adenylyltransferase n=1 Tax=Thermanaeromonas sp. TaxID=2003697 RepID=UPI00243CA94B|nr:pantetheine-phosphate adenylyltransferase [Thermanaeromonas sp.]MCG0277792.1 pantetheine-phosphate adenylyltransferase [Thermanaeromonas sp.]
MRVAVFPGTFDPITLGHMDLIRRSCKLFDKVIVAVGDYPFRDTLFSVKERVTMVRACTEHLPSVEAKTLRGLLVEFARKHGACAIIRGLRAVSDFEQEFQVSVMNKQLADDIETIFLMPATEYCFLSSRVVRQVASVGGSVKGLVPPVVEIALKAKF